MIGRTNASGNGGSGSDLDFSVVAYASEEELPATAKENTIAIITGTPIDRWTISPNNPYDNTGAGGSAAVEPTEGVVWIRTLNSSTTSLSIIKGSNKVMVKPAATKQYRYPTDGDFVEGEPMPSGEDWYLTPTKIYQDGAWHDLWDGTLVDGTKLYYTPAGQLELAKAGYTGATVEVSAEKGGLYLYIGKVSTSYTTMYLTPAIDLTDFTTLEVTWQGHGYFNDVGFTDAIVTSAKKQTYVASASITMQGSTMSEITTSAIDVSGLSGYYYFCTSTAGSAAGNGNMTAEAIIFKAVLY